MKYNKRKTVGGDSVMDTRELDKIAAEAKLVYREDEKKATAWAKSMWDISNNRENIDYPAYKVQRVLQLAIK